MVVYTEIGYSPKNTNYFCKHIKDRKEWAKRSEKEQRILKYLKNVMWQTNKTGSHWKKAEQMERGKNFIALFQNINKSKNWKKMPYLRKNYHRTINTEIYLV